MDKSDLFKRMAKAVLLGDKEVSSTAVKKALELGFTPNEILEKALIPGIRKAGDLYEKGNYFLPELIACANAMKSSFEILKPIIENSGKRVNNYGKVVIGTVEGDIHDIGKTLVSVMLGTSGFEVIDLGADVPTNRFIEEGINNNARIICLSALLTTTMLKQRELIETLVKENLRDKFKVIVGGAPVTAEWAESIGADGYGKNAVEAVIIAEKLIGVEKWI
ncbi:MAG: corrinoid protein [Candidatus Marinimicrobia bacterium]|nr:corrinoid protein [Candidatus Neomarinimicrobiota bacterium]